MGIQSDVWLNHIISYLDVDSILNLKKTSKFYYSILTNENIIKYYKLKLELDYVLNLKKITTPLFIYAYYRLQIDDFELYINIFDFTLNEKLYEEYRKKYKFSKNNFDSSKIESESEYEYNRSMIFREIIFNDK